MITSVNAAYRKATTRMSAATNELTPLDLAPAWLLKTLRCVSLSIRRSRQMDLKLLMEIEDVRFRRALLVTQKHFQPSVAGLHLRGHLHHIQVLLVKIS